MLYKTEKFFKEEIEVICGNQFEAGLNCIEFQQHLEIVEHWIQCEWQLGHIDMSDIQMFKLYAKQTAFKYWQI